MTAAPISPDLLEAAHWLIAGTTGSGKTYLARGLLEQLRRAGRRVGAVDKMGKLWGLTISADGKDAGLEFVILGGKRPGAVPMRPIDGARIGRLFVERNIPAIFDLSQWEVDDQEAWVADFARAIFATNETALHLLFDEAQSWVPANGGGEAYKAVRLLAEQGRGNGINLLMTAPRLNGVDVGVRQALGGMVAMRQTSARDQAAVAELIGGHLAIDEKALRANLGKLPTGCGYVWSPAAAELQDVSFPENATFDSSRTPRHGDAPPPPIAVSSALVDELRAALAPSAEPPKAEGDQVGSDGQMRARARISELEAGLAAAKAGWSAALAELDRADAVLCGMYDWARDFVVGKISHDLLTMRQQRVPRSITIQIPAAGAEDAAGEVDGSSSAVIIEPDAAAVPSRASPPRRGKAAGQGAAEVDRGNATSAASDALNGIAAAMLANLRLISPAGLTWPQAAQMVRRSPKSGPFYAAKRQLVASGAVRVVGDIVAASGDRGPGIDRKQALAIWRAALDGFAPRMLDVLADESRITRDFLGQCMDVSTKSGPWYAGLKQLRERRLIQEDGMLLRLARPLPGQSR